MRHSLIRCLSILLVFSAISTHTTAQSTSSRRTIPIEELLNGPDRQDLPWKITVQPPRLMYQQRFIVQIRVRIPSSAVTSSTTRRSLHFILRVKTEDGSWSKDGQFNDFPVPANLGNQKDIEYATGVYFRPGNYTLALIAIERDTGKISVLHRLVRVDPVKDDPFPELDRHIPAVEFPAGFPQQEVAENDLTDGELFPIAHQDDWIAIDTGQPILLDVVLNISKRSEIPRPDVPAFTRMDRVDPRSRGMMKRPTQPTYHLDIGRVLQIGNVISHLSLKSGCIRVSAIDALRAKTIVDREDGKKLDWNKFEDRIEKVDQNTVDASVLANKKGPAQFVNKYLDTLSNDSGACGSVSRHYVVVVSHEVSLPSGAKDERLASVNGERARFYYLHGGALGMGDDISEILKPVRPVHLDFSTPKEFRKSFGRLVGEMRSGR